MKLGYYKLKYRKPVLCKDVMEWGKWYEISHRRVRVTYIGDVKISTVFLGLDHSWSNHAPILFETMIFGDRYEDLQEYQTRCSTWREALAMHWKAVNYAKHISQIKLAG